jgi:ribosomal-protein-alanine N-acetyltransferase
MIIREYTLQDKNEVLALLRLNTPNYFSPHEEKDLVYYLNNEIELYFVIEIDNLIVGCGGINFSTDKTIAKISWDIMHPSFQGKGIGSALLNYRLEKLTTINTTQKIMVRTSQLVYRFYEKLGFTLIKTVDDYWATGFHLYEMEYVK